MTVSFQQYQFILRISIWLYFSFIFLRNIFHFYQFYMVLVSSLMSLISVRIFINGTYKLLGLFSWVLWFSILISMDLCWWKSCRALKRIPVGCFFFFSFFYLIYQDIIGQIWWIRIVSWSSTTKIYFNEG